MATQQHTPGPWKIAEGNATALVYALDETGGVNRFSAIINGGYIYSGRTEKERTSDEEVVADALLIAAAPDLLETGQEMLGAFAEGINWNDPGKREAYEAFAAAIARALGEPTPL